MPRTRDSRAALLALGLCGALTQAGCRGEVSAASESKKAAGQAGAEPAAIEVEVGTVDERPMPDFLLVTGTLLANRESKVAAGVPGKVLATHVERGSEVKKGDVLITLDRRTVAFNVAEATATAEAAHAQRTQAKADCERARQLLASNAISKSEFDRNLTQCEATQAQAQAAEARAHSLSVGFGDSEIRAPFAGSVAERNVNPGEYVQAQATVCTLVELDPLRLELSVPESAVSEMKPGLPVEFRLAANDSRKVTGIIRYVGPVVRRQSRDLLVEAVVENKDRSLIPGMFASARIHTGDPRRATVPEAAVRTDGSLHHVFVVTAEGKAEDRIVQLGQTREGRVAILDGLKPGEKVAMNPGALVDGTRVKVR